MLRLAFDFIITWRETRTRPNAYNKKNIFNYIKKRKYSNTHHVLHSQRNALKYYISEYYILSAIK